MKYVLVFTDAAVSAAEHGPPAIWSSSPARPHACMHGCRVAPLLRDQINLGTRLATAGSSLRKSMLIPSPGAV